MGGAGGGTGIVQCRAEMARVIDPETHPADYGIVEEWWWGNDPG